MKKYTVLLALALVACQTQEYIGKDVIEDETLEIVATKASVKTTSTPRIVYLPEKDIKAWTSMRNVEDRFKACDTPESTLTTMTTESIVESLLYYPMNFLVLAYNDPLHAVKEIVKNSTLHRELLNRPDGTEAVLARFAATRPTRKMARQAGDSADDIPFQDELFLDYFIASGLLPGIQTPENRQMLRNSLAQKAEDILTHQRQYGTLPLTAISYINTTFDYHLPIFESSSTRGGYYIGLDTLHTPFGKPIEGRMYTEADDDEIDEMNNYVTTNYPNVIIRGNASPRYNCHSYAWHQNNTSNTYWINSVDSYYQEQVSKYYTDDYYESTTITNATRARYMNSDHSATVLSSGKFLSKWGQLSLVEHDYNDCPYNSTQINYYRAQSLPKFDNVSTISGPSVVSLNTQNTYIINYPTNTNVVYTPSCECLMSSSPSTFEFTQTSSSFYSLVCHEYGSYKIYVKGYRGTTLYSVKEYLVVCVGGMSQQGIAEENQDYLSE